MSLPTILVTGGAGFIGTNLAADYLQRGHHVIAYDNLSRPRADLNLAWLRSLNGDFEFMRGDLVDFERLLAAVRHADIIFHLGGQVAVTTSVADPRGDFEANALGTLNILEACRLSDREQILLYASTNKVYGKMSDATVVEQGGRYAYAHMPFGVPETYPLDFYSPYGCSKGTGDQYTRDYARIYGLRTVVLRQSCIYGPHQFGHEDQGWLAHFVISALLQQPITIYGDGKQVRDVLYITDLLAAYRKAIEWIDRTSGNVYNIGGGIRHTTSLRELLDYLQLKSPNKQTLQYAGWRPGDQRVYISDTRRAESDLDWKPCIPIHAGVDMLWEWVEQNRDLLS